MDARRRIGNDNGAATHYRELLAGFTSRFHDLRDNVAVDVLSPDPDVAYPAGQALARDVLGSGENGLAYPSARREDGHYLVALRPHLA